MEEVIETRREVGHARVRTLSSAGTLTKDYICGKSVVIVSGRSVAVFGSKSGLYLVAGLWSYLVAGP